MFSYFYRENKINYTTSEMVTKCSYLAQHGTNKTDIGMTLVKNQKDNKLKWKFSKPKTGENSVVEFEIY